MSTGQTQTAPTAAPLSAAVTTAQVFATAAAPLRAAALSILGSSRLKGRRFVARASGVCTTAAAGTTFAPFLAVGSALLIANDTIIAQAAPVAVNATSSPWWIEALLIFDGTSGKLHGVFDSLINNTFGAVAPVSTVLTGLRDDSEPPFSLVTGGLFSSASAGNIATLSEFILEA